MQIIIKIIILFIFSEWIENFKYLEKYKDETKFNVYRSLMCIYFSFYSLELSINNFTEAYGIPFDFTTDEIQDLTGWFISYLILDMEKMIISGNKRWDLYLHHIWCLFSFWIAQYYDKCGYFHIFLLINESISIVSGIDSMYLDENKKYESMLCKKYRKNIINWIRLPIWILVLLTTLHHNHDVPSILFWNGLLTSVLMIGLDKYWEGKCQKVIDEFEK
jgi:hypothetical protein